MQKWVTGTCGSIIDRRRERITRKALATTHAAVADGSGTTGTVCPVTAAGLNVAKLAPFAVGVGSWAGSSVVSSGEPVIVSVPVIPLKLPLAISTGDETAVGGREPLVSAKAASPTFSSRLLLPVPVGLSWLTFSWYARMSWPAVPPLRSCLKPFW